MSSFFASCPQGLEYPLLCELQALGAERCHETRAGVAFEGELDTAYRACLWSRFASRVLMPVTTGAAADTDELYALARDTAWEDVLPAGTHFAVQAASRHPQITNTHFAMLRVKDGVVDRLGRERVVVDPENPAVRLYAFVDKDGATLGVDLCGRSLHERGYRRLTVEAPLKENLAAAVLWRAGWPDADALLDPFCGSGTLLIEAAWMAADVAPGLLNTNFALRNLSGFDGALWNRLVADAESRRRDGLAALDRPLIGYDHDPEAIRASSINARTARVSGHIQLEERSIRALSPPGGWPATGRGLIVTNPPYGERLDPGERGLFELYRVLGETVELDFPANRLAVLTAHDPLAREIALPLDDRYRMYNGPIACRLFVFDVPDATAGVSDGAEMVANRIRKNQRRLKSYLRKNRIGCYRAYDADIPEYAVAVDVYETQLHVQEYEAPKEIPVQTTRRRLQEAVAGVRHAFDVRPGQVFVKARSRQRGTEQYGRLSQEQAVFWVREGNLEFKINLSDYLDTGLFLDHRETRRMIGSLVRDKRFLNLFCYTGAFTVYAAAGGARETTSVDLSKTYLDWARENLRRNRLDGARHEWIRADCIRWLERCRQTYDVILLDPPTFSTSKSMAGTFDVQRDHAGLIDQAMGCLAPDGILFFSNNFNKFKLDDEVASRYACEEITHRTLPPDFDRKPAHRCWSFRHTENSK